MYSFHFMHSASMLYMSKFSNVQKIEPKKKELKRLPSSFFCLFEAP